MSVAATAVPHFLAFIQYSPAHSETHFKVVVVSEEFTKVKTPLQRHRMVNSILESELEGPVHALSIVAKTPKQWESMQDKTIEPSPSCRGGDGSLPPKNG
jgi:BolA protein